MKPLKTFFKPVARELHLAMEVVNLVQAVEEKEDDEEDKRQLQLIESAAVVGL
jgi:hypothetical protein